VPALGDGLAPDACSVASYPATDHQGYVWVYGDPGPSPAAPAFSFPYLGAPGYASIRFEAEVEASLHATLENMLDVPHTGFLHRGLFRNRPAGRRITAVARRFADRAEIEYLGEERPPGLLARLLAPGGGPVVHFDRFLLPSIAQVDYRLGNSHLVATNALTPVDDFRTRFVSVVSYRLPLPSLAVRAVLVPLAKRIFRQDSRILRLQTDAARRFGAERYRSTEVDLIGAQVWRLLKRAEAGEIQEGGGPEFEKRVELVV
jgi:phenylpropionate dioxygenase-like ring-hydroxylating dioxygenase large terminal subunit